MLSMEMACPSETSAIPLINSQFLWASSKTGLCIYGTKPPMTLVALGSPSVWQPLTNESFWEKSIPCWYLAPHPPLSCYDAAAMIGQQVSFLQPSGIEDPIEAHHILPQLSPPQLQLSFSKQTKVLLSSCLSLETQVSYQCPSQLPGKGKENLCPSLTLVLSRLSLSVDHFQITPEASPKGAQFLQCTTGGGNCNLTMKIYCISLFPVTYPNLLWGPMFY